MVGTLEIIFAIVYVILMIGYLFTTSLGRSKIRGANKILLALTYLILAFIEYFTYNSFNSYKFIILIALFFTFLGDVILLFKFTIGAIFFTLGNITLFIYNILILNYYGFKFGTYWWFILILLALLGGYYIFVKFGHIIDLKHHTIVALSYLLFVSLHGSIGFMMIFLSNMKWMSLLAIGCCLFTTSDYLLCTYKYSIKPNEIVHKMNTLLYFSGIILITFSIIPI